MPFDFDHLFTIHWTLPTLFLLSLFFLLLFFLLNVCLFSWLDFLLKIGEDSLKPPHHPLNFILLFSVESFSLGYGHLYTKEVKSHWRYNDQTLLFIFLDWWCVWFKSKNDFFFFNQKICTGMEGMAYSKIYTNPLFRDKPENPTKQILLLGF